MGAAVAAALTAGVGNLVVGRAGAASPAAPGPHLGSVFTIVERGTGTYQDEATKAPPDFTRPIPAGDTVAFKADLLQASTVAGEARGACTSVFDGRFVCAVVFSITGHGTLALQVLFDLAQPAGDYAVTGGTGEFAGRHGWAHFVTLGNGDEVHTFHLSGGDG